MTLQVLDATSTVQSLSTTPVQADGGLATTTTIADPVTGTKASVSLQGAVQVSADGIKATYRYAGNATPAVTPTDFILIPGSSTKTGRIKRIALSGIATTAGSMPATLLRRSADNTGGTRGAVTAGKHDRNDLTPTVVPLLYSANASALGAAAGNIGQGRLWLNLATAAPGQLVWDFCRSQDKALILRGTTDFVAINLNAAAVPAGGSIDYEIEIEEDGS